MCPPQFISKLLEMASRAIFDPANCFSHPLLPLRQQSAKSSTARRISDYIEVIPIEGKGLGTVAIRDIEAFTLLYTESPACIAVEKPRQPHITMAAIAEACRKMAPNIRARFDALHEGSRPFQTREMRIWKTNCFEWDPVENRNGFSAIFLNISLINHSCLPNAEYRQNFKEGQMELYSTQRIRAGQEVTICYGSNFHYMTASERKAYLHRVYGFICKCLACADGPTSRMSDQRRRILKETHYCGIMGQPAGPNFSAVYNINTPNSIEPITLVEQQGFADGMQIFRPGTAGLLRREVKLMYDEGFTGSKLLESMFTQAMTSLIIMHKRMTDRRSRVPLDPHSEIARCIQLMQASELLLRQMTPVSDPKMRKMNKAKDNCNQMWNVAILEPPTVAQCKQIIPQIMNEEPDPFAENNWSSRLC
jgi:hypothetical protein